MSSRSDLSRARKLLEADLLPHVVTLKMLRSYADQMTLTVHEAGDRWAILSVLPVRLSEWDRRAYPEAHFVAFLDSNNLEAEVDLFPELPKAGMVLKTGDESLKRELVSKLGARKVNSYVSFTTGTLIGEGGREHEVQQSGQPNAQVERLFEKNGYSQGELRSHFLEGARWFAIEGEGQYISACFVYQNYGRVWEIGGVHTEESHRGQGLAQCTVGAAIRYLLGCDLIPRYQVQWDNEASIRVARKCGLQEFLRFDHFRVEASGGKRAR